MPVTQRKSSSAVAERPCNASCLLVVSLVPQVHSSMRSYFSFRFTAAYNYILFCSRHRGSPLLAVIKDSLMCGSLCGKLHGRPLQQSLIR